MFSSLVGRKISASTGDPRYGKRQFHEGNYLSMRTENLAKTERTEIRRALSARPRTRCVLTCRTARRREISSRTKIRAPSSPPKAVFGRQRVRIPPYREKKGGPRVIETGYQCSTKAKKTRRKWPYRTEGFPRVPLGQRACRVFAT